MLEYFLLLTCISTPYYACEPTARAYYEYKLQDPLTNYWERNRIEAIENTALMIGAASERKLPIKLNKYLLTLDANQSIVTLRFPF